MFASSSSKTATHLLYATDAQRKAAIGAADYPRLLEFTLLFVYNTLVLALGILMADIVMLRSAFGKARLIWVWQRESSA